MSWTAMGSSSTSCGPRRSARATPAPTSGSRSDNPHGPVHLLDPAVFRDLVGRIKRGDFDR